MSEPGIYTWSTAGFDRFREVWKFEDFWTRGNTFDACLHFVMAAKAKWPADPKVKEMESFLIEEAIPENVTYVASKMNDKGVWADDFGWWGIACLTAHEYLVGLGQTESANEYLSLARDCWTEMVTRGYEADNARPVPNGCENRPSRTDEGTKNTVTNAGLFLLSIRLYIAVRSVDPSGAGAYLEKVFDQYQWFSSWFESQHGYLRVMGQDGALVQERPIAEPDYENKDHPGWEPGWVWSGDQGLVLAALIGLREHRDEVCESVKAKRDPSFDPAVFESNVSGWSTSIATGIKALLFGGAFSDTDHVLREAPFESSFGAAYDTDYVCGRGVLLRYLAEANAANPVTEGITATAKAVWDGREEGNNQFGARWNAQNDAAFNEQFKDAWGYGDTDVSWEFPQRGKALEGILQATGLDVLGAAIPHSAGAS